jgi:hypothetical protein
MAVVLGIWAYFSIIEVSASLAFRVNRLVPWSCSSQVSHTKSDVEILEILEILVITRTEQLFWAQTQFLVVFVSWPN